ncbi:MAG: hypothetical protein Q9162_005111 [Coniocarpon cinnabarinum]
MKASLLALLPVVSGGAVVPRQSYFSFGNAFSTGPVATNSWIREATTTLVLPALNNPHNGNLGLWPGMGTKFPSGADGQLVQGLAISTVGRGSPCNFAAGDVNWCAVASTYDGSQHDGTPYRAKPGDHVTYNYKYNDATSQFDQTVSVNGAVVSTLSTTSGQGAGWGTGELTRPPFSLLKDWSLIILPTAMECQQANCGTVPQHQYLNTTITMNTPDPNYSRTLSLNGATGNLVTADGGKTWTVATITIQQYTYH